MKKTGVSPIMTWVLWGIVVLGVFMLVTWEYFVAGFSADTSRITYLIVFFFIWGFIASLRVAYFLQGETRGLKIMDENQRVGDANLSHVAAMFDAALVRIRRGDRIDIRNLVSAYGAKIKSRTDNISVLSNMLITIGLLGTVVGLIITVTGLGMVLNSNSADYASMKAGLNRTVSGMGTAFYTTFFGALLGGVVLKVLAAEMKKSATQLVADVLRFGELFLSPMVTKQSSDALVELDGRVAALCDHLEKLGGSVTAAIDTIDTRQQTLAAGLEDLAAAVEKTSSDANERAQALVVSMTEAIETTGRQADERLRMIIGSIEETNRSANDRLDAIVQAVSRSVSSTNEQANERLQAVIAASRAAVEETNRLANEHMVALMERVGSTIDQTQAKADERFGVLAAALKTTTDEVHRLADERLRALVKTIDQAAADTHRQANDRLVELVDTVSQSIESERKQAEARIAAKANDLAGKLNEAASLLSVPPNPAGESEGE